MFDDLNQEVTEQYEIYKENGYNKKSIENYENKLVIIIGLEKFKNRLSDDNQKLLENYFGMSQEIQKQTYIFVDTLTN